MKKVILIIAILLIFLALSRSYSTTQFVQSFENSFSQPFAQPFAQPFFGDAEDDNDAILIKEFNDTLKLSTQCNSAKNVINKSVAGLREELKSKKTLQKTALDECKVKVPAQIERYKKLFKALNGREPTAKELDNAKGFYEI